MGAREGVAGKFAQQAWIEAAFHYLALRLVPVPVDDRSVDSDLRQQFVPATEIKGMGRAGAQRSEPDGVERNVQAIRPFSGTSSEKALARSAAETPERCIALASLENISQALAFSLAAEPRGF